MGLNDCQKSYLWIPPLVRLHSFLVHKVLLLLVTAFQDYYHFKPSLNIENIIKIMISRLKSIRYIDIFILTRKIKNHTWIHYVYTWRAQAKTLPSVLTSSQFYIPSGQFPVYFNAMCTTCARELRYTGFTIVQLDTYELHYLQYRPNFERSLSAEVDRQKLKISTSRLSWRMVQDWECMGRHWGTALISKKII